MICRNCGAPNDKNNLRCGNCKSVLQEPATTTQYAKRVIQSPLRQAQPSNIISANNPSFSQRSTTEGQAMNYQSPQDNPDQHVYDPGITPEIEPESVVQPQAAPARSRSIVKTASILLLVLIAIASAGTALYLFLKPADTDASFVFAEAEKKFSNQNYASALVMYREFVNRYPEDYLVSLAQSRIETINNHFAFEKEQKEHRIEELLQNAKEAFRKQRYLKPQDDNVLYYTSGVLELDPANPGALELQALVVRHFEDKALDAQKKGFTRNAVNYYENILQIMPNDSTTLAKIEALKSRKR